mmetsp:Transcript_7135/g.14000  ORF Transcript_7135/g.14000 Transcript_7135/m.14000 type:complete len:184 (-) Transcript_7135:346-897(-)
MHPFKCWFSRNPPQFDRRSDKKEPRGCLGYATSFGRYYFKDAVCLRVQRTQQGGRLTAARRNNGGPGLHFRSAVQKFQSDHQSGDSDSDSGPGAGGVLQPPRAEIHASLASHLMSPRNQLRMFQEWNVCRPTFRPLIRPTPTWIAFSLSHPLAVHRQLGFLITVGLLHLCSCLSLGREEIKTL